MPKHKKNKNQARYLTRGNLLSRPGKGEDSLERGIAALGMAYERQACIGGFFVDYLIKPYKLVVEVDDSNHLNRAQSDQRRQEIIESRGYRFIRLDASYAAHSPINAAATVLDALNEFELNQYKAYRRADMAAILGPPYVLSKKKES